ncbi:MBOAT family O-acyltransferase [Syntrophus aciditrophicus]|nr:MBOAT family O-acyltransferase [Syntrophus aciditrophicus]
MLFNSLEFALFFSLTGLVYFLSPFRLRVPLLVVASYIFYITWRWEYAFLLLAQTGINFGCGWAISCSKSQRSRSLWLACAVVSSLGILFLFKYYNFFLDALGFVIPASSEKTGLAAMNIAIPVGISFYTLQALGYSFDVYRGKIEREKDPVQFALFVGFFPQLLSGPIERAGNMLKQFRPENAFDLDRMYSGLALMLWGLFKKVVIADRLAVYVNLVYNDPQGFSGPTLLLATYFFAFQIYCDFSGYSDMAIGAARVLGYDIMTNFRLPYFADSISDFWHRWHISLSTWFRDYLYIPLGGNRGSLFRQQANILMVFAVSGLWHGANWTFVLWGALHGFYYILERVFGGPAARLCAILGVQGSLLKGLKIFIIFHLVTLAWVFFKARSVTDALHVLRGIFTNFGGALYLGPSQLTTLIGASLIFLLMIVQFFQYRGLIPLLRAERSFPIYIRWPAYAAMIFGISIFGISSNEFIYFQF